MIDKVLNFWFKELQPKMWWIKDTALDEKIKRRFGTLHERIRQGECDSWRTSAKGALAEIIVLDQFSRNMFRGTPDSFVSDSLALALAQGAIERGYRSDLGEEENHFLIMPFMHSESKVIHQRALELFAELGNESALKFEKQHKAIIDRFGRYPHRNEILGRKSTPEELEFLTKPGSSF